MERESKDSGEGSQVNTGAEGVWRPRRLPVNRGFSDGQAELLKFNFTIAIITLSC